MDKAVQQITALPAASGAHARECDYPASCSEVVPIGTPSTPSKPDEHSAPYQAGWLDGCFGESGNFVDNPSLTRWKESSDRLDYYRGHRAGSEAHRTRNTQNPDAREKLFR
jgi:hypothetical protein